MRSLRGFLTISLVIGITLIAGASGAALYFFMKSALLDEFDKASYTRARALAALVEIEDGEVDFEYKPDLMPEYVRHTGNEFFELHIPAEKKIGRSPSLDGVPLVSAGDFGLKQPAAQGQDPRHFNLMLPDGKHGRGIVYATFALPDDDDDDDEDDRKATSMVSKGHAAIAPGAAESEVKALPAPTAVWIVVARDRESVDRTLTSLITGVALSTLLVGLVSFFFIRSIVRRGLDPLDLLGKHASSIDAHSLSERMPTTGQPAEIQSLALKLNELISRLEDSFARERRMTANIAHELRTPIAELHSTSEIAARWNEDSELQENLAQVTQDVAVRMNHIVGGLLHLARIESGEIQTDWRTLDLAALILSVWERHRRPARERDIRFEHRGENFEIQSDAALLEIVVSNLISNAVHHGLCGSVIRSELFRDQGVVSWRLQNRATGLETEDLEHLAEPFWCKDASRSGTDRVGLGLTLARQTAEQLHASLSFELQDGDFRTLLKLPESPVP